MENEFEIYMPDRGGVTRSKQYVSVTASKTFGFPRPFLDAQNITNGLKVVILYSAKQKKIAFKFTDKNPAFAYSVRMSKNPRHGAMVISKKFFDDKDIDASRYAGHYDFVKVPLHELGIEGDGDAYVISLEQFEKDNKVASESGIEEVNKTATDEVLF